MAEKHIDAVRYFGTDHKKTVHTLDNIYPVGYYKS